MKRRTVFAILVLFVFILMSAFALAQPERTEATLIVLSGRVVVVQDGGLLASTPEKIVTPDQAVLVWAGDEIRVGENAAAQLRLFDGSTVDLAANTTLQITELYTDQDNYRVQLSLTAGKLLSRVKRILGSGDTFDITTPSSTASVRGTVFAVTVVTPDVTHIACTEGTVAVQMGATFALVPAGTELTATVGQPLHVVPLSETDPAAAPEPIATTIPLITPLPEAFPTTTLPSLPDGAATLAPDLPIVNTPATTPTDVGLPSVVAPTTQPTFLPTHTRASDAPNLPTNTAVPFNPTQLPPTPVPISSVTLTPMPPTPVPNHTPTTEPMATTVPTQIPTATAVPTQPPTTTPMPPSSTPVPSNTPEPSPTSGGGEPQITICHKPNGPNNGQTMTIPESALPAHLGHGDTIGPCP